MIKVWAGILFLLLAVSVGGLAGGAHIGGATIWITYTLITFIIASFTYAAAGRAVQLREFASQNALTFMEGMEYDERAGTLFSVGHSRVFPQLLIAAEGRDFAEVGNYRYTTGGGRSSQVHDFGIVRIKLPRRLPNMVLDSKKNNFFGGRFSNLGVGFPAEQRLSLEGDFDKYFTLYAPAQYKRDALYVFTPDVMHALVMAAHAYDCEVIDDDFYLYSSKAFKLTDRARLMELAGIARILRGQLAEQTDYYADERVGDRALNTVASEGARLRTRLSPMAIVGIVCVALYVIWMVATPFLQPAGQ